jgi:hypothetical protein
VDLENQRGDESGTSTSVEGAEMNSWFHIHFRHVTHSLNGTNPTIIEVIIHHGNAGDFYLSLA